MSLSCSLLCYCPFYYLVFTGWYFSFTQAAEASPRHSWSNTLLTGPHTTLLQPFLALNMHHLESRSDFFQWMGYVKIQVKFAWRGLWSLFASEEMKLFWVKCAPQVFFRGSFVYQVCTALIYKWDVEMNESSRLQMRNHTPAMTALWFVQCTRVNREECQPNTRKQLHDIGKLKSNILHGSQFIIVSF